MDHLQENDGRGGQSSAVNACAPQTEGGGEATGEAGLQEGTGSQEAEGER